MRILKRILNDLAKTELNEAQKKKLKKEMARNIAVSPIGEPLDVLCIFLVDCGVLDFQQLNKLKRDYAKRNPLMWMYRLNTKEFGNIVMRDVMNKYAPQISTASRETDIDYEKKRYNFYYNGIRIKCSSTRAFDNDTKKGTIENRAFRSNTKIPHLVQFQHLFLGNADVYVWTCVWSNKQRFWILNVKEAMALHEYFRKQTATAIDYNFIIKSDKLYVLDKYEIDAHDMFVEINKAYARLRFQKKPPASHTRMLLDRRVPIYRNGEDDSTIIIY